MVLSRVLLVFATVALAYSNYPSWVDYPDPGSIAIILAIFAVWLVPYAWWYRCFVRRERNVTNNAGNPTEVPKGVA